MTERLELNLIRANENSGRIFVMLGAILAVALFIIVLLTGSPIKHLGNIEVSLLYSFLVCIPVFVVVGLSIRKVQSRK